MERDFRKIMCVIVAALALIASTVFTQARFALSEQDLSNTFSPLSEPLFGKLLTSGNKSVAVNGTDVPSGTTIISGAEIKSSEGVRATVLLKSMGRLDIASNTVVVLAFGSGTIDVELKSGCLVLTTHVGTEGSIKTPGRTFESIGPDRETLTDICTTEPSATEVKVNQGAAKDVGVGAGGEEAPKARPRVSPWMFAIGGLPFVIKDIPKASSGRPEPVI